MTATTRVADSGKLSPVSQNLKTLFAKSMFTGGIKSISISNASNAIILLPADHLSHFVSFYGRVYPATAAGRVVRQPAAETQTVAATRPYFSRI